MIAPTLALLSLSLAAADGPSFDCAKARAADEKLVCAEPALAALDRELAGKYEARAKAADPAAAAELKRTQRAWLEERASCTRGRGSSAAPVRAVSVRCLETSYRWRIGDLEPPHEPARLPAGIVWKRILRRDPRARDSVDVSYPALAPGRPGAAAFDAHFAKAAEALVGARGGPGAEVDDDPDLPATSLDVGFTVPLSTPRLVTVVTSGYDYGGGAHGMPFVVATTFDLERGRPLTLDDVFAKGAMISDALIATVMKRLGPDTAEWEGAETNAHEVLADGASWTFAADGATVTFPPYSVGPYAIGSPEVRFTWAELKPHLKPGAPLPPR